MFNDMERAIRAKGMKLLTECGEVWPDDLRGLAVGRNSISGQRDAVRRAMQKLENSDTVIKERMPRVRGHRSRPNAIRWVPGPAFDKFSEEEIDA